VLCREREGGDAVAAGVQVTAVVVVWWRCCLPQIRPTPSGSCLVLAGAPPESSATADVLFCGPSAGEDPGREGRGVCQAAL
jgi:hypothetical protein